MAGVANAVRGALRKTAREQRTTSWNALHERTGHRLLPTLGQEQKIQVLALVDQQTATAEPLLSTLLTDEHSDSLQLHRAVARTLDRALPGDDAALVEHLRADVAELHRLWQHR